MTFAELRDCKKWWFGPLWLSQGKENWPGQPESLRESDPECLREMKAESRRQIESDIHKSSTYSAVATELPNVESMIEYERYSSFERIIRITAWVQRFITNIRRKSRSEKCVVGTLRVDELQLSESLIIKDMQRLLLTDKNYEQWEHQLNSFTDDTGIIRCRGRLSNADLSYSAKFPVFIPARHYINDLIIMECHAKVCHNGLRDTLSQVCTKSWIIKGRQRVKSLIHKCVTCKRHEGKSYQIPPTAALPDFRVTPSAPFDQTVLNATLN